MSLGLSMFGPGCQALGPSRKKQFFDFESF